MSVRHDLSLARTDKTRNREKEQRPLELSLIKRLFSYTQPYAFKRNILFFLVLLRGALIPLLALVVSITINGPITDKDLVGILWYAIGFGAFALFLQITLVYRQKFALELGESVVQDLRNLLFRQLMRMPMSYFNKTRLGRIISRMTTDIETLRTGVQNVLFVTIVGLMQMICSGICMAYYNIVLFSVILVMAPLLWIINQYFHKKISATSRELQESFSRVTASLVESVKGIRVTQGFVREDINAGIFRRLVQDHSSYNLKASRNTAIYIPLLELNSQFFIASILMIGGYGTLSPDWDMPVADLISFFFLANLFFNPISQLGLRFTDALSAMAGAERVFRLLDAEPEWTDASDAQTIDSMKGQLEFRNVTFAYEPENPVLHDINFKAEPGQTIALVGHTGCGKTSIINLISKFYLPTSGEILIDGKEIRNIKSASLRSQMGVVLQNNFIFSGTVLDNIRLGKLDATDEEVIDAVRQLNCLDLIGAMTEGIRTKVTEKGGGLSLGQQQLICFARAFLADPRILMLDEATSSIDTITEARLQESMSTLLAGRTSIVVAHRLSTIRSADLILVLDDGRIVERGTHTELLSLDGTYSNLYRQFIDSDI